MAETKRVAIVPKVPTLAEPDEGAIAVDYDCATDTLAVTLTGAPRPAISVYADDDTILRVDPETEEVVGVEVENFLARLLRRSDRAEDASMAPAEGPDGAHGLTAPRGQQKPRR